MYSDVSRNTVFWCILMYSEMYSCILRFAAIGIHCAMYPGEWVYCVSWACAASIVSVDLAHSFDVCDTDVYRSMSMCSVRYSTSSARIEGHEAPEARVDSSCRYDRASRARPDAYAHHQVLKRKVPPSGRLEAG